MRISKLLLALTLALPIAFAQLPSIAERALKREAAKKEAEARRAKAAERRKAAEEDRKVAAEERTANAAANRAEADATRSEAAAAREKSASAAAARVAKPVRPVAGSERGITGPLHEKYLKQVVFVKVDRVYDEVKETDFATEFTLGDPLYFRVYMEKTGPRALEPLVTGMTLDKLASSMFYGMRFTIAGKPTMDIKFHQFSFTSQNLEWTTWRGLFTKGESARVPGNAGQEVFAEFLARAVHKGYLAPGKSKIKVEVYPFLPKKDEAPIVGAVVASGEFTLNYPAGVINAANPKFCMPYKQAQKDVALEGQILKYAQTAWTATDYKPASVVLTSHSWVVNRHPISGVITTRMIEAAVVSKGAEFCKYQGYQFSQVFEGNSYAPGTFTNAEPSSHFMPCACIAK
jgi:hypothetical protein